MSVPAWYVPDADRLGIYVLVSCVAFPLAHLLGRLVRGKPVTRGQFIDKIVLGGSAPTFAFLALSPIDPALLSKISDQPYILCMTGVIGLALCIFALFDNDS